MLTELVVEGLGVIERTEVSFDPGATAITGETGAGKTLVVAALGLLLGERGDRALVREGAAHARVQARFVLAPDHPGLRTLEGAGVVQVDRAPVEVIADRTVGADGRGKVRVNGRLVTLAVLAAALGDVVEIAGQNGHRRLGDPAVQRGLLDAFAGDEAGVRATAVVRDVRAAAVAERRAAELREGERERARTADLLRYEIREIEAAAPTEGETERLRVEAARLENAETIAAAVAQASHALGGEDGAHELLTAARRSLEPLAPVDPSLAALAARLETVGYELADVVDELRSVSVASDPHALDEVRGRLATLSRLHRKYGDGDAAVLQYLAEARRRVDELGSAGSELAELEKERDDRREAARRSAIELSDIRRTAAEGLAAALEASLADLALGGARVEIDLAPVDLYEGGLERVELRISANPGEPPRPLAKVASGGELSRIALALHLLTSTGSATTMVFDEVDVGVGGRAAQAVGRSIARLARARGIQVIVVTHLPQVAAFADDHRRVVKRDEGGRVVAVVETVEGESRIEELSRMLAGLPESERAREHAVELLELGVNAR